MELEKMFLDSKWDIIQELARKPSSPVELSKKLKSSIANITIQLQLLEALSIVEKQRLASSGRGKPRTMYTLEREFAYLTFVTSNIHGKKLLKLDQFHKMFFNIMFIQDYDLHALMLRLYFDNEAVLDSSTAWGVLGNREGRLEILVIHPNAKDIRMPETTLPSGKGTCSVSYVLHAGDEFARGIQDANSAYVSALNRVFIIWEKESYLSQLKTKR